MKQYSILNRDSLALLGVGDIKYTPVQCINGIAMTEQTRSPKIEREHNASRPSKLFGTDGVRGRSNRLPMTVETALALGRALGVQLQREPGQHRVVIGKDTRLSCYMYENALISGLCSMGINTLMVGPFPTPGVAFITRAYRAAAGIVISASHNPYHDNGIKFFSSEGFKFNDAWEAEVEKIVQQNDFSDYLPAENEIGRNSKIVDADGRYIEFVKATFPRRLSLKGLTIALDCSNGAGYKVAPLVFKELDAQVHVCGNRPNGVNINDSCGSLHPSNVQKELIDTRADVGIALDGDADRVLMVDENGQIIDGDTILAICAADMQKRGLLRTNKVVATAMSNYGFFKAMEQRGLEVITANVGDRYVIQEMLKHDTNLGGEQSGHLIFSDHNTTGDGLVSALQVLRIMIETESKLSELATIIQRYPQALINVEVAKKPPIESLKKVQKSLATAEKELGKQGRVLLRYSGTEPILRVMVEGPTRKLVNTLAEDIAESVDCEIGMNEESNTNSNK